MGLLHGTQRALLGGLKLPKVGFSLSDITFTERMAKRAGALLCFGGRLRNRGMLHKQMMNIFLI
jgi:hypothetical protein